MIDRNKIREIVKRIERLEEEIELDVVATYKFENNITTGRFDHLIIDITKKEIKELFE